MFLAQNKNPKKPPSAAPREWLLTGRKGCTVDAGEEGWTDTSNPSSYVVISGKGLLPSGRRRPRQKRLARIANFSSIGRDEEETPTATPSRRKTTNRHRRHGCRSNRPPSMPEGMTVDWPEICWPERMKGFAF